MATNLTMNRPSWYNNSLNHGVKSWIDRRLNDYSIFKVGSGKLIGTFVKPGSRLIEIFESKVSFLSSTLPSRKTSKHFSLAEERIKCLNGRNIEGGNVHGEKRIGKSDRSCGPSTTANGCPLVVAAPIQLYIQFLNNFVLDYELTNSISDRVSVQSSPIYRSNHLVSHLWFPNFYPCKQIQFTNSEEIFLFLPRHTIKIISLIERFDVVTIVTF